MISGFIWDVNSFDQWGVELGKVLAEELTQIIEGKKSAATKDGSTKMLLARIGTYKKA